MRKHTPSFIFTNIDPPTRVSPREISVMSAGSINNRSLGVGTYVDSSGTHGFICDNSTLTTLNAPGP